MSVARPFPEPPCISATLHEGRATFTSLTFTEINTDCVYISFAPSVAPAARRKNRRTASNFGRLGASMSMGSPAVSAQEFHRW